MTDRDLCGLQKRTPNEMDRSLSQLDSLAACVLPSPGPEHLGASPLRFSLSHQEASVQLLKLCRSFSEAKGKLCGLRTQHAPATVASELDPTRTKGLGVGRES